MSLLENVSPADKLPTITVVTPSLNQAAFLEEALLSVLGQGYPQVEYIVMDGGSTDESPAILARHGEKLDYWQSRPDGGQAAAVNAAFRRARGDILGWVNSDDYLLPGALWRVARKADPARPQLIAGNGLTVDLARKRAAVSDVRTRSGQVKLRFFDFLLQPATFFTRAAWESAGELDESLHYAFDWDWFVRAEKTGAELVIEDELQAVARVHPKHKTGTGGAARDEELAQVYARHCGEAVGELFRRLARKRGGRMQTRRWLKRLGLKEREPALLRRMERERCRGLSDEDLAGILAML